MWEIKLISHNEIGCVIERGLTAPTNSTKQAVVNLCSLAYEWINGDILVYYPDEHSFIIAGFSFIKDDIRLVSFHGKRLP